MIIYLHPVLPPEQVNMVVNKVKRTSTPNRAELTRLFVPDRIWDSIVRYKTERSVLDKSKNGKFPAGPGEATENQFAFASGGWGYPPDPH
jgi:hypothetical protein